MANRRMRSAQLLQLVRRLGRRDGLSVVELARRGKGSHKIYLLVDSSGTVVARFGLTDHGSQDLSWPVISEVERALEGQFGERWTERR